MIDTNETTNIKLPSFLYDKIECKVTSLYKEFGISSVPVDPFEIAGRRGYIVKPFSSFSLRAKRLFKTMSLDGANYYDPNLGTFVICYDDQKGLERIRFTLMHEIGHIDMGHWEESELARRIADYYAAYALAPTPIISIKACKNAKDIAKSFMVSQSCADICFKRFINWDRITVELKPHEMILVGLFQNI